MLFVTSLAQIDPFLYGYFSDETLEHGERVGLALLHAAHHLEIGFSPQMLPEITPAAPSGSSGYSPSQGLWFNTDQIMQLADEYPEHRQTLCRYVREIELFRAKARRLYAEPSEALDRSGAEWGGGWGGHSNPDYGRKLTGSSVSAIPMIIVFLSFQKYFTRGITVGAVKG